MIRFFSALFLICAAAANLNCRALEGRREIHTLANLQALAARLERMAETEATVNRENFGALVEEYFEHGDDPWGNTIIFVPGFNAGHSTFLLISTGSDGALDVVNPEDYFDASQQLACTDREGQDIVMKGSKALRYGAHK